MKWALLIFFLVIKPSKIHEICIVSFFKKIVLKEIAWKNKFFEERLAKSGIKDFKFTYDDWCSKPYIGAD